MLVQFQLQLCEEAATLRVPDLALLPVRRGPSGASLCCSLVLHFVGVPLLPFIFSFTMQPAAEPVEARLLPQEYTQLVLRMPPRPQILQSASRPAPAPQRRQSAPAARKTEPSQGVFLLQPAPLYAEKRPVWRVPAVAAWTGALPPPPKPVTPGAREPLPPAPLPATLPSLQAPVEQALPGDIAIPKPKPARSRMTLPPSSPSPITILSTNEIPAVTGAPGSSRLGTPVAVVAITGMAAAPGEAILLPPGVSRALPDGAAQPKQPAEGGNAKAASTAGTEAKGEEAANRESGPQTGTKSGFAVSAASGASREGTGLVPNPENGTASEASNGPDPASEPDKSYTIPSLSGEIRVVELQNGSRKLNYPAGGSFDSVVIGSGGPAGMPPPDKFLKGKPIYTAYLQVGASRDWILQFCEDRSAQPAVRQSGMVLSLGDESRLEAPYLEFAEVPTFRSGGETAYSAYHFQVSTKGAVTNIRPLAGPVAEQPALIRMLAGWRFRAAVRGGKELPIEAILLVPPGPFTR
jgi:hypothetical protein